MKAVTLFMAWPPKHMVIIIIYKEKYIIVFILIIKKMERKHRGSMK